MEPPDVNFEQSLFFVLVCPDHWGQLTHSGLDGALLLKISAYSEIRFNQTAERESQRTPNAST
jgi:hypothetical protein